MNNNVTVEDLLTIIGQKEVQILVLQKQIAQMQQSANQASKPPNHEDRSADLRPALTN